MYTKPRNDCHTWSTLFFCFPPILEFDQRLSGTTSPIFQPSTATITNLCQLSCIPTGRPIFLFCIQLTLHHSCTSPQVFPTVCPCLLDTAIRQRITRLRSKYLLCSYVRLKDNAHITCRSTEEKRTQNRIKKRVKINSIPKTPPKTLAIPLSYPFVWFASALAFSFSWNVLHLTSFLDRLCLFSTLLYYIYKRLSFTINGKNGFWNVCEELHLREEMFTSFPIQTCRKLSPCCSRGPVHMNCELVESDLCRANGSWKVEDDTTIILA